MMPHNHLRIGLFAWIRRLFRKPEPKPLVLPPGKWADYWLVDPETHKEIDIMETLTPRPVAIWTADGRKVTDSGITYNPVTGVISGTPKVAGNALIDEAVRPAPSDGDPK